MKVLVIGATGQTGKILTKLLIEQKHHTITVLVRRPEAITRYGKNLEVVKGDATNLEDLRQALRGQDVVISTLGTRSLKSTNLETSFMSNLLELTKNHPLKRLIYLSGWGAGDSLSSSYPMMKIGRRTFLKNIYDDKDRAETILFASKQQFVNVRPGRLTNGPAKGNIKASLDGSQVSTSISRIDVANFLLEQIDNSKWLDQSPLIGYKK